MAKKEIIQQRFDGGIADDIREQSTNKFAISQHFDNTSAPFRLTPYRDSESANTTQTGIVNFCSDGSYVYGMGVKTSGGLFAQIYRTTSTGDITSAWLEPSTSTSGTISYQNGSTFIYYKGYIYLFGGGTNSLDRWQIGGTYTDAYQALGYTLYSDGSGNTAQGLIHSKTDTLYIPYENKLFSMNNTTPTAAALTLPSQFVVTALAEYGNYLAIACRPATAGASNSVVFLWDMVSADITESIDFGAGDLWVLGNVEGRLFGVMNAPSSPGITFSNTKVLIKVYNGGKPTLFKTLTDTGLTLFGKIGYKPFMTALNTLSFGLYSTGSLVPTGIYTISRSGENSPFQITCERLIHNSTSITSLAGLFRIGDVIFTSYNNVVNVSSNVGRTNDTASYTATSSIETVKYNGGSTNKKKRVIGIAVSTAPLPASSTITVGYKADAESSYTTIGTITTTNAVYKEFITIESTGKNLPECQEIQFKISSTGGAEITGWRYVFDEKDNLLDLK